MLWMSISGFRGRKAGRCGGRRHLLMRSKKGKKKQCGHCSSSSHNGWAWSEPIPIGRLEVGSAPDIHDNYEIK